MPDLKSQDLGNGFRLVFQKHQHRLTGGGMVRAVVKDARGNITARGLTVPVADADVSKRMALMEHMAARMAPAPSPCGLEDDYDEREADETDEEEDNEPEEEDFS